MTHYQKPARTFDEQVELMLRRGMCGDRDSIRTRLSMVNYYRLSAYWYPFRVVGSGNDELTPGTDFEVVWDRYVFDQQLRILTMEAIERIEVAVRTQLAYHHAHAYDPFAYATTRASLPRLLGKPTDFPAHGDFVLGLVENLRKSKDQAFVRHFTRKYTSSAHLPIWMAIEIMSIGDMVTMYWGCDDHVRDCVANVFGRMPNTTFGSWLNTLQHVRNICAHHGRLWNRALAKMPAIPKMNSHPEWYSPNISGANAFAALTICSYLLRLIAAETATRWNSRVVALFAEHPNIPFADMGRPTRWGESPIWFPPPRPPAALSV